MTARFWRKKINRRILSGHQGLVVWWSIGPRQMSSRSVTNEQIDLDAQGQDVENPRRHRIAGRLLRASSTHGQPT